jgi:protease-4
VAEGRKAKLKPEQVKALADGKVWTGSQALPLGLVDQIADFQGAVDDTAKAVGISGEPTLVRPPKERRRTLLDVLAGEELADLIPTKAKLMESQVGFYYLWK